MSSSLNPKSEINQKGVTPNAKEENISTTILETLRILASDFYHHQSTMTSHLSTVESKIKKIEETLRRIEEDIEIIRDSNTSSK